MLTSADLDTIKKHLKQPIQDALDQRETDNQYQLSPIAFHKHNGTDSAQVSYNDLTNKPSIPATPITIANGGTGFTTPRGRLSTDFQYITDRFTTTTDGSSGSAGAVKIDGLQLKGQNDGYATVTWLIAENSSGTNRPIFSGNPIFYASTTNQVTLLNYGEHYLGIGKITNAGAGHTFTPKHIGFKIISIGSTNWVLYATQADGTTENASILVGPLNNNTSMQLELLVIVNSGTSATYYYKQEGATWSAGLTLTANLPSGNVIPALQFSINSAGAIPNYVWCVQGASYER